jgi:hypothetical protein
MVIKKLQTLGLLQNSIKRNTNIPSLKDPLLKNFSVPSVKYYGDSPFVLVDPESNSNGSFTYSSDNISVATISEKTVTIKGPGTTIIKATQQATNDYISKSIEASLVILEPIKLTLIYIINDEEEIQFYDTSEYPNDAQLIRIALDNDNKNDDYILTISNEEYNGVKIEYNGVKKIEFKSDKYIEDVLEVNVKYDEKFKSFVITENNTEFKSKFTLETYTLFIKSIVVEELESLL